MISRPKRAAFSLVEVVLSLGVIAFAMVAMFGLIPAGLQSGGQAIDATRTALIGKDVQTRAKGSVTYSTFTATTDLALPTWFYDRDGNFIGSTVTANSIYRIETTIHGTWGTNSLPNVDQTVVRPTTVTLQWPVNTTTGNALGSNSQTFSFYVRRP